MEIIKKFHNQIQTADENKINLYLWVDYLNMNLITRNEFEFLIDYRMMVKTNGNNLPSKMVKAYYHLMVEIKKRKSLYIDLQNNCLLSSWERSFLMNMHHKTDLSKRELKYILRIKKKLTF